jgi:hypothetical protein
MIKRMENVGIVVEDLAAGTAFFLEPGMELEGEAPVDGPWADRVVGSTASESTLPWCSLRTVTAGSS